MADNHNKVYRNPAGEIVPRVSSIVKMLGNADLIKWANRMGLQGINSQEYVEMRADIGTDFHNMAEEYMTGKEITGTHFKESLEMMERFRYWVKCHQYQVYSSEQSLVNDFYGGTYDAIGTCDGALLLVDYKTSTKIHQSYFVQLAGYMRLIEELMPKTYKKLRGCMVVSMRAPKADVVVDKKRMEKIYRPVFDEALRLYYAWKRARDEEIGLW